MPDTSKTLAAVAAVVLAASITATETEQHTETEHHGPALAAPAATSRGPVGRDTRPSITATGPDTPGR